MENTTFVDTALGGEVDRYINESISELYDLILDAAGQEFFLTRHDITTEAARDVYHLPNDFYILKGVDVNLGGTSPVPIRPYMFDERFDNQHVTATWAEAARYRLLGFNAGSMSNTDFGTGPLPGVEMGTIAALFDIVIGVPNQESFSLVNASDISAFYPGQVLTFSATSGAALIGAPATATVTEVRTVTNRVVTDTDLATIPAVVSNVVSSGLVGQYNASIRFDPPPGSVLTATVWYIPHAPQLVTDAQVWNGFNGWEEYVVIDSAIKCIEKEEGDISALLTRKNGLEQRIKMMSQARDQGFPERITDAGGLGSRRFGHFG